MKSSSLGCLAFILIPLFVVGLIVLVGGEEEAEACTPDGGGGAGDGGGSRGGAAPFPVDPDEFPDSVEGTSNAGDFSAEQLENAAEVMKAAAENDISAYGQLIGVTVAVGESNLINVGHGDDVGPDSRGLFQQRAKAWGPEEKRMDPYSAATAFFGVEEDDYASAPGLVEIDGWEDKELSLAGNALQRNADPLYYAQFQTDGENIIAALEGGEGDSDGGDSGGGCESGPGEGGDTPPPGGWEEPGPWGGYDNGTIPVDVLAEIPWAPGEYVRKDAVGPLIALNKKFEEEFGENMFVTDSYRTYEEQVDLKRRKGGMAAEPGTSKHGWALALDLGSGINDFNTPQHEWMLDNAPAHGWISPEWARPEGSLPEAWHWEFWGAK